MACSNSVTCQRCFSSYNFEFCIPLKVCLRFRGLLGLYVLAVAIMSSTLSTSTNDTTVKSHLKFYIRYDMSKYGIVREGCMYYSFVVADGCCDIAAPSHSNGDILILMYSLMYKV